MSAYELFDLLGQNSELISDTWYFFLTVHLAIFGIVHIASRRVHFFERALLYAIYGGLMYVNYQAQADNYATYIQLSDAIDTLATTTGERVPIAPKGHALWVIPYLSHVYLAAGALSVLVIFFTSRGRQDVQG